MIIPQQIIVTRLRGRKRHFSFDLGQNGSASLVYENIFCKKAVASINELQWKIERKGFFKRKMNITAQQSPYSKTTITFGWTHKISVRAEDNNTYQFKPIGFWQRTWGWFDSGGQKLIEMRSKRLSRKRRGIITFFQPVRQDLLWLMLIGWGQLVCQEDNVVVAAG